VEKKKLIEAIGAWVHPTAQKTEVRYIFNDKEGGRLVATDTQTMLIVEVGQDFVDAPAHIATTPKTKGLPHDVLYLGSLAGASTKSPDVFSYEKLMLPVYPETPIYTTGNIKEALALYNIYGGTHTSFCDYSAGDTKIAKLENVRDTQHPVEVLQVGGIWVGEKIPMHLRMRLHGGYAAYVLWMPKPCGQ